MDKWIRLLFMILLIYNMLYDIILTLKQSGHSEFKDSKSRNSRTIADKAVMPLVLIMFIALILFVEFNRLVPRIIVVIIITIPTILQFIVGTIKAADSIKFIVMDEKKRNRNCSSRSACLMFACGNQHNHKESSKSKETGRKERGSLSIPFGDGP